MLRTLMILCGMASSGLVMMHVVGTASLQAEDRSPLTALAALPEENSQSVKADWLIVVPERKAEVCRGSRPSEIVLSNGLIRRAWRLTPNAATVSLDNLMTGESLLRAVRPEAMLELNGVTCPVGGLVGQPNHSYLLPSWLDRMQSDPLAFELAGFEVGPTIAPFAWKRCRYSEDRPWPPPGASLTLRFRPSPKFVAASTIPSIDKLTVSIHYEMYDGIPLICKWLEVQNDGEKAVRLNRFTSEILAAVEYESVVDRRERWEYPNLHVESDYEFAGMDPTTANKAVHWVQDPQFTTQVSSADQTPCLLEVRPPRGPDVEIPPGEKFQSFRTFELIHDSTERERRGLAVRRMYRTVAPWCTENPIMMHVLSAKPEAVRLAIDQAAEAGFEMVIITFWSGIDLENEDPKYLAEIKSLVEYAHSKGIELGAYSLLASRSAGPEHDVVNPPGSSPGGPKYGSPCLESRWGHDYFRKLYAVYEKTGLNLLEHDGSYPGEVCCSTEHPGHRGLDDSQWKQWIRIRDFYRWCRGRGIYLNVPDFYYLNGSNKCGMGYRESNWSLPREQQILHARQNIFDGTWQKTPSMGWMFVPLTEYGGGGRAATIEPLSEHLNDYEAIMANLFGCGVQACYRGPRLFDTEETKQLVKRYVAFYKRHREILDSDLIHVRRADGRDLDCMLHVNPRLRQRGFAAIFNPTDKPVQTTFKLPLYYTGLEKSARIRSENGSPVDCALDRRGNAEVPIQLGPKSHTWLLVEETVRLTEWTSLFAGDKLSGWTAVDGARESWNLHDGVLTCSGGGGGWLSTDQEYEDFELELKFRLPQGGNSGVFLRSPREGDPAFTGMEIQVLDDHDPQFANLKPTQYTGSLYGVAAATPRVTKPAGQWQTMSILLAGTKLKVTVNETTVVETSLSDRTSNFPDHPGLKRERGFIGLQNHSTPIKFRNLRIREIR